jgi:D-alanyl-D-alanine carboxypeptidase
LLVDGGLPTKRVASVEKSVAPSAPPMPAMLSPVPTVVPELPFNKLVHSTDDPDSVWVVVNKARPLKPGDFAPDDLTSLGDIPGGQGHEMRAEAAAALLALVEHAERDGVAVKVSSAYRPSGQQANLYRASLDTQGRAITDTLIARPSHSEHQTGLAVDVFDTDRCRLKRCFEESDAYAWLVENAAVHGYIVRYRDGHQDVTGFRFEPWHLRFVGPELAQEMAQADAATLEEFFGLPSAPTYLD